MNFKQFLNEAKAGYDNDGYITLKHLEDKIAEGNATINFNYDDVKIKSLADAKKKYLKYTKDLLPARLLDNDGKITVDNVIVAKLSYQGKLFATKANGSKMIDS